MTEMGEKYGPPNACLTVGYLEEKKRLFRTNFSQMK